MLAVLFGDTHPQSPQTIPSSMALASSLRNPIRLAYLQEIVQTSPWLQGSPPCHKFCLAQLRKGATRRLSPKYQASWHNLASRRLTLRPLQKRRKREPSQPSEILRRENDRPEGLQYRGLSLNATFVSQRKAAAATISIGRL
ncbi:hypothetical protein CaCOL14_011722 [Colletotrichum acutatum]